MNFTKTPVTNSGVEILVGLTDMHTLTPIKVDGSNVVKAGTPLGIDGKVANSGDAAGILLYDVDPAANPNGSLIQSGPIDAKKAQAHCGLTYAAAMMAALDNIQFRTNIGVNQ